MGLFHSIFKAIPVIGDIVSASDNKKAVGKANAATQLGITNATGALNNQLATTTANYQPYLTAGTNALGQESGLLGLNGADQQSSAISALQASPMFQSLFRQGQDTILNNASATGGLRGGNVQSSLANFGSDTLAQVIQQQLANLGGLSSQGLSATGQLGQLGANNASQIAGLDTGAGQANAGAILGKTAIDNNLYSGLRQQVGSAISAATGVPGGGSGGFNLGSLMSLLGSPGAPMSLSGAGSGYGASGGSLPNFPNIGISLPSSSAGLPGF